MKVCMVAVFLAVLGVSTAKADDLESMREEMAQMKERMAQLEERLAAAGEDAGLQSQVSQLQGRVNELEQRKDVALPSNLKWLDSLKIGGDFRYRHEWIDAEGANNRHRHRMRARVGITADVDKEWRIGFRLATGDGSPVSTNQDLGNSFSMKDIYIDRAFLDYHPQWMPGLNIFAGKMPNPFMSAGGNQLIWDGDVTPEGIAFKYKKALDEQNTLFINGGGFWVRESSAADISLWSAQGGLTHKFDNGNALTGGVSFYRYANIQGATDLDVNGSSFFGNTSSAGAFVHEYELVELFSAYDTKLGEMPFGVYGSYVNNVASGVSEDTGWLVGTRLNKASKPGSWELSYDYRDLEADAVVGAFSDSDFRGGGTNGRGHRFGGAYQLTSNVQTGLTYLLNERGNANTDYRRLQADVSVKF